MTLRIEYRFNKHGRAYHCFDVVDETGHCLQVFRSYDAEKSKAEARAYVKEKESK